MSIKSIFGIVLQGLGAMLALVVSLMISNMIAPLSPAIMVAVWGNYRRRLLIKG